VKSEIKESPNAKPLAVSGGAIEFGNVRFQYQPERPLLNGATFTVPAGKRVAVVGSSGSGKSTILRLLYRFYDPTEGSIRIDGQELSGVTLDSLRRAIGVVPQDCNLFNDTIFYNIAYGDPNSTREQVIEAAKLARVHESIMAMPKGYDTVVGERGLKLSGGEKQRVAIARMVLKKPRIVLCDEATSSLDSETEHEILENLKEVTEGRTAVFIAHRLSTVVDMDLICVLDKGQVAESGTHWELLAANGKYASMWARQQAASQAPLEEEPPREVNGAATEETASVNASKT